MKSQLRELFQNVESIHHPSAFSFSQNLHSFPFFLLPLCSERDLFFFSFYFSLFSRIKRIAVVTSRGVKAALIISSICTICIYVYHDLQSFTLIRSLVLSPSLSPCFSLFFPSLSVSPFRSPAYTVMTHYSINVNLFYQVSLCLAIHLSLCLLLFTNSFFRSDLFLMYLLLFSLLFSLFLFVYFIVLFSTSLCHFPCYPS